jgi:hypothetical protein
LSAAAAVASLTLFRHYHPDFMSLTIGCLSEGKLFITRPGEAETEIKSAFVDSLKDRLQSIKSRREWKMSGTGAQFARGGLPVAAGDFEVDRFQAQFSAVCPSPEPGRILYAIDAGDVYGIFSYSLAEREEQRLVHGPSRRFSWLQFSNDSTSIGGISSR